MNFKVNNSNDVKKAAKKAKVKASSAESASFAEALSNTQQVNETGTVFNVDRVDPVIIGLENTNSDIPDKSKERGYYILDLLEELEKDILSGTDTEVVHKLEEALKVKPVDIDSLPSVVRGLIEEIDLRATLELEKIRQK